MRSRLAKLAAEAKKIKVAPATARVGAGKNVKLDTQYRILESPGCRRVVLAGPEGRVDARTAESLLWKLQSWETNYLIQAVVLQGRPGKDFSAGWVREEGIGPSDLTANFRRHCQLSYLLATLRKPTIAWYTGDVVGGGMGLGLARYRVSTEKSTFQVVGPKDGWILDGGLSYLLPRLRVGPAGSPAFARYLSLTGASLSGLDMLATGLSTHHMQDSMAGQLHNRLADLTFEPDFMVEDVMSEHAAMFYKLDTHLNPPPYHELWAKWAKNDENRKKLMKRASGVMTGFEDDDRWNNHNDDNAWGASRQEVDPTVFDAKEEAAMEAFVEEEVEEDPDIRVTLGKMEPLSNVFLARNQALAAEEEDFVGGGPRQTKSGQPALPSDTAGSLWWHRNFAEGDDAIFNAQWEVIEARIKERVQEEGMEGLGNINEKFMDNFPEYITYPERKRLVDADKVLLSPWDCSVDRAERFPDFMELAEKVEVCFKGESVEEVVEGLRKDNSAWAQECLRRMDSMSSLSLKIVFRQLDEAKEAEIEDVFRMDYRVGQRLLVSHARANADGLAGMQNVSADQVSSFFQPFAMGEEELDLPEREQVGEEQPQRRYIDMKLQRRFAKSSTTRGSI